MLQESWIPAAADQPLPFSCGCSGPPWGSGPREQLLFTLLPPLRQPSQGGGLLVPPAWVALGAGQGRVPVSRPGAGDTYIGHRCRVNTLFGRDIAQRQAVISSSLIRPPDAGAWLYTKLPGQELAVLSSCHSSPAQEALVEAFFQLG